MRHIAVKNNEFPIPAKRGSGLRVVMFFMATSAVRQSECFATRSSQSRQIPNVIYTNQQDFVFVERPTVGINVSSSPL